MRVKTAIAILIPLLVTASALLIIYFGYFSHRETFTLKAVAPSKEPENVPEAFFPPKFPWRMKKSSEESDMFYASYLPRKPEVAFSVNISANMGGTLANAIIDSDKIFLADSQGVYALNRDNGTLAWGVEVYSDTLEGRAISHLQPATRWKALGLFRFVTAYGVGKHLFVGTSSELDIGDAYILALDKDTGELLWKIKLESEANASSRSSVTSNLIITDGRIYVGSVRDEGYVFCVTEDGDFLWRVKVGANVRGLAYGDGKLFVTSEPSKRLYAFDAKTGDTLWVYEHDAMLNTPSYKNGRIILSDSRGNLLALSEEGSLLWKKFLGISANVNTESFVALDAKNIYAVRGLGEKPLNLFTLDFDGNIIGNFTMANDERGGKPLASQDMIILPTIKDDGKSCKIYFLWQGWTKIGEFAFPNDGWMPSVSAAYSEVYIVASPCSLYKLADTEKPDIKIVGARLLNETLIFETTVSDEESALYKVLLVYSLNNSSWNYMEMEISRRYVMEPVGGYGLQEEAYRAEIQVQPNILIDFYIAAIDNSGNYEVSSRGAYHISKE